MSDGQAKLPWFQRRSAGWGLVALSVLFVGTWFAGKLLRLPWPDGSDWQAIWTFFTFLVAAVAASVALAQLSAHQAAQRELSRPFVVVDFAFRSILLLIEVRNIGQTPARNVQLKWDVEPKSLDDKRSQAIKRNLVDGSIPFLAPGRSIRYFVGRGPDYWASDAVPKRYEVTAAYSDAQGHTFGADEKMILDLSQWAEALADSDYDNKNWNQFKWQTKAQKEIAQVLGRVDGRLEDMEASAKVIGDELRTMRDEERKHLARSRRG